MPIKPSPEYNRKGIHSSPWSWMLFLILTFPSLTLRAQDGLADQYWGLRTDLVNDFMLGTGSGTGESLIGYRRVPREDGNLKFGDNTIKLGIWISTLAMEYALLLDNGEPTYATVADLYHALSTVNRLDLAAEPYFFDEEGKPGTPALNGFLLRDDVDSISPAQLRALNTNSQLFPVKGVTSDFLVHRGKNLRNQPSQDQMIYLMMGMAFVVRLVPEHIVHSLDGESQPFADGETSLRREAVNILGRLTSTLNPADWTWMMSNPVNGRGISGEEGGDARTLSWGFYLTWRQWTGASERSPLRARPYRTLFNSYRNPAVYGPIRNGGEGDKIITLAAISGAWGSKSMASLLELSNDPEGPYDFPHIPLIYHILFGDEFPASVRDSLQTSFLDLLEALPCGEHPYNYGDWADRQGRSGYGSFEWSSNYRVVETEGRGRTGRRHWNGVFGGFDWLFYHNLYRLAFDLEEGFALPLVWEGPYYVGGGLRISTAGTKLLAHDLVNEGALVIEGSGETDTLWVRGFCEGSGLRIDNAPGAVLKLEAPHGSSLVLAMAPNSVLELRDGSALLLGRGTTLYLASGAELIQGAGAWVEGDGNVMKQGE